MSEGAANQTLNSDDQLVLDLLTASSTFDSELAPVLVPWWQQAAKGEAGLLRFLESKGVLSTQAAHLVGAVRNGHLKRENVRVFLTAQGMSRLRIFLETARVSIPAEPAVGIPTRKSKPIVEPSAKSAPASRPVMETRSEPKPKTGDRQNYWDKFPRGEMICFENGSRTTAESDTEPVETQSPKSGQDGSWDGVSNGDFISFNDSPKPRDKGPAPKEQVVLKKRVPKQEPEPREEEDWDSRNSGDFIAFGK